MVKRMHLSWRRSPGVFLGIALTAALFISLNSALVMVPSESKAHVPNQSQLDTVSLRARLVGHKRRVNVLAFSPDGRILASGANESKAFLWDITSGTLTSQLPGHKYVGYLFFSPDGRMLATGKLNGGVGLWEVKTGQLKVGLFAKKGMISAIAFSPDSRTIATARFEDSQLTIWDTETGQLKGTISHEKECAFCGNDVGAAVFGLDGRTIATSGFRRAFLWDVSSFQLKMTLVDQRLSETVRVIEHGRSQEKVEAFSHASTIYRMSLSPDGRTLATGSRDTTAKLWDLNTGKLKATLKHSGKVLTLAFSHDSRWLATGSDDTEARIWDAATGELKATLSHKGTVWSIDFSPDGKLIVTAADNDHAAKVWDVATGSLLDTLTSARYPVVFSPDGRTLATGDEKDSVLLWDVPVR